MSIVGHLKSTAKDNIRLEKTILKAPKQNGVAEKIDRIIRESSLYALSCKSTYFLFEGGIGDGDILDQPFSIYYTCR